MKKACTIFFCMAIIAAGVFANGSSESQQEDGVVEANTSTSVELPRSVTFLVGSRAGGFSDMAARTLTEYLQKVTKTKFAVVNQDTATANENMLAANPDGATLTANHVGLVLSYLSGGIDFDPREEFTVICEFADGGDQALIVPADAPYDTMAELADYAQEHPGEVSCAMATNSTSHCFMTMIANEIEAEFKYVECSSESDKLTNVAGGFIDFANCSLANASQYEEAGMVKVLGTFGSGTENNPRYPQWKSLPQQGIDVTFRGSFYLFAPAGTSDEICEAYNLAIKDIVKDEKAVSTMGKMGSGIIWNNLEVSRTHFAESFDTLGLIAKQIGMMR